MWILAAAAILSRTDLHLTCHPKDTTARILKSASPNDTHPDWRDGRIGTGWSLRVSALLRDSDDDLYLTGDLVSTHGGVINRGVYVLETEWECGPVTG